MQLRAEGIQCALPTIPQIRYASHSLNFRINVRHRNRTSNFKSLGKTVREFRLLLGLTPAEFADDVGCSSTFMVRLEEGEVSVDIRTLEKCHARLI